MILGDIYHPVHPYTWRQAGCASLRILICSETSKRSIRLSFWSSERKNQHCQQLEPDKWNFQQCSSQLYM